MAMRAFYWLYAPLEMDFSMRRVGTRIERPFERDYAAIAAIRRAKPALLAACWGCLVS